MLKDIPGILSPKLLAILCEMGHADTIVLGDGNFPAKTCARHGNCEYIRADGIGTVELMKAILRFIPLDYCDKPIKLMAPDRDVTVDIWNTYKDIINKVESRGEKVIEYLKRDHFYDQAQKSFCIVQTGESAIYANVIIQKGVIE